MPALSMRKGDRGRVIPNFVEGPWALTVLTRPGSGLCRRATLAASPALCAPCATTPMQRLRKRRQLDRMARIENATHLFLVLAETVSQLDVADASLAKRFQDCQLGGHIGSDGD
jgi:hypothetical protein